MPSHQDLQCLPFLFCHNTFLHFVFYTDLHDSCFLDNGLVLIQRQKNAPQKVWGERVNRSSVGGKPGHSLVLFPSSQLGLAIAYKPFRYSKVDDGKFTLSSMFAVLNNASKMSFYQFV